MPPAPSPQFAQVDELTTSDSAADFSSDVPDELVEEEAREGVAGLSPFRLGLRRLRRNKVALAFGLLFVLLVGACLAAPLWAYHVAETGPLTNHLSDKTMVDGKEVNVVGLDGVPIGPTYRAKYFLGADENGRDIMVRLLYGGRNSLMIGVTAALLTTVLSVFLGLLAGYMRGKVDTAIRGLLDIVWSFPVIILGVALGVSLALGGLQLGPINIAGDSLLIPVLVIGVVYVPYMARPVRGQVLALREKEFIEAAQGPGGQPAADHVLRDPAQPRVDDPRLLHASDRQRRCCWRPRSRSSAPGCGRPTPSWGTMIDDGVRSDRHGAPPRDRARGHAGSHRAGPERVRRRRARRAGPARQGQTGPLMTALRRSDGWFRWWS